MSLGLAASIAEVAAMSDSGFCKRFRSFYDSSPLPTFPVRKRYRGTSELILDTNSKEDKEVEEGLDSNSVSEDAKDEGPTAEDEDPAAGDEGVAAGDESLIMRVESLGLGEDEAVPEGQQQAASVTPPSPEWTSGLLPISSSPSIVPSPISSPMISLTFPAPEGLIRDHTVRLGELSLALFERYDRDVRDLFTRSGEVRDEIFSQRYRFRSLEYKHERTAVTFRALWRHVLALEAWAGRHVAARAAEDGRSCYCFRAGKGPHGASDLRFSVLSGKFSRV
nr:hypothetical protein [Tanacetum cinerariifolium]